MKYWLLLVVSAFLGIQMAWGLDVRKLEKSAERGSLTAQMQLAMAYEQGNGVTKDAVKSALWFRRAAEQGSPAAQTAIGIRYEQGNGVPQDYQLAAQWYRKAAERGDETAQGQLGMLFIRGDGVPQDSEQGFRWLMKAAQKGSRVAQFLVGEAYRNGVGVAMDTKKAEEWFRKAAAQGFTEAKGALASMASPKTVKAAERKVQPAAPVRREKTADAARRAKPVEPAPEPAPLNEETAKKLEALRAAAEAGDAAAQCELGNEYFAGRWIRQDMAMGAEWIRKSADQGRAEAQRILGLVYRTGEGVPKDLQASAEWSRKAAEQGDARAQFYLGRAYAEGAGVPKNTFEALKWLKQSAEQDDTLAQTHLATMFLNGGGVPKNSALAFDWHLRAAKLGDPAAQTWLALVYGKGRGIPKDEIESMAWLNIAVANNDKYAETLSKLREDLENELGRPARLLSQQRSKELMGEIAETQAASRAKFAAKRGGDNTPPANGAPPSSGAGSTVADALLHGADRPKGSGSGTIVSAEGHILTAAHVVEKAARVKVLTSRGLQNAKILEADEANDLAVLQLEETSDWPALTMGASSAVRLGQSVATIGFPNVVIQGFSPKVTRGEINSLKGMNDDPRMWQISVPLQPGNSGGALLDDNGRVVGVVVSSLGRSANSKLGVLQNVNYAVKGSYALSLLETYLPANPPAPQSAAAPAAAKLALEELVEKVQPSIVLILVY